MSLPDLSIVIPAFDEEKRLPGTLRRIVDYLDARGARFEIVVVDDGSHDATGERVRAFGDPRLRLLRHEPNRGKGYAVRRGMLESRGQRRLMTDADLSTPIQDLPRLEQACADGHGVAIGSRALPGSNVEVRQAAFREGMGRLFNVAVRTLLLPDLRDTQCGFKLFSGSAATAVFNLARLDGFCFDVESLVIARRHGFKIAEVPVTWRNDEATRVSLRRGARAFTDLWHIRKARKRGDYDPPAGVT